MDHVRTPARDQVVAGIGRSPIRSRVGLRGGTLDRPPRNLGLRPDFFQLIKFWSWAISVPGTPGYFENLGSTNTVGLENADARNGKLSLRTRFEIFFKVKESSQIAPKIPKIAPNTAAYVQAGES